MSAIGLITFPFNAMCFFLFLALLRFFSLFCFPLLFLWCTKFTLSLYIFCWWFAKLLKSMRWFPLSCWQTLHHHLLKFPLLCSLPPWNSTNRTRWTLSTYFFMLSSVFSFYFFLHSTVFLWFPLTSFLDNLVICCTQSSLQSFQRVVKNRYCIFVFIRYIGCMYIHLYNIYYHLL